MVVGGPTTVLDLGGLRIVSDPTFDGPGPHGYLTKTAGPAVAEEQLGPVDLVLVSHDNHADNLDDAGRALALAAPLLLTTTSGAGRLGHPAEGFVPDHQAVRAGRGGAVLPADDLQIGAADADRLRPHQDRPVLHRRFGHVRERHGVSLSGNDRDGTHTVTLAPGHHLNITRLG